jgi:hypothetical protein
LIYIHRNLYADDSKLKENKTPEPPLNGEDADGKDTSQKGRRSRGILFKETINNVYF